MCQRRLNVFIERPLEPLIHFSPSPFSSTQYRSHTPEQEQALSRMLSPRRDALTVPLAARSGKGQGADELALRAVS